MSAPVGALLILACLLFSIACLVLAYRIARQARQLDELDAKAEQPPPAGKVLPVPLPSAGRFPVDTYLAAVTWSELRAQQDATARDIAAATAATTAEIRALTAEAEQRIPARWRHQPPPRSS